MAHYFSPEFKEHLKSQSNLLSLVQQVTKVNRMGNTYIGICPFHDDQDPSFYVNPMTNTFYCHGCGAGSEYHSTIRSSDVISFVQHAFNKSFYEAVLYLADTFNVPLPASSPEEEQKQKKKQQWYEFCKQVQIRFRENLANNEEVIKYLFNRGITKTDIDRWGIGLGDDQNPEFKNTKERVTFPVYDYQGHIISFTGRVPWSDVMLEQINHQRKIEGKNKIIKYWDAPNFEKRKNLYGIHVAKKYIRHWKTAILVEGWTDVISMHRHGMFHTVSTMGTALTKHQAQLLKQAGAQNIIIIRDGDDAGTKAAMRDGKILKEEGMHPYVFPLENHMDPDDLCMEFGELSGDLAEYINSHKMSFEQWSILKEWKAQEKEIVYHLTQSSEKQQERRKQVLNQLKNIHDLTQRESMIEFVSGLMMIEKEEIKQMLNQL